MVAGLGVSGETVPSLVAGALTVLLAVLLLFLDFNSRLGRAFALVLVFRGAVSLATAVAYGDEPELGGRLLPYVLLAAGIAALHFGYTYRAAYGGFRRGLAVPVALLLALITLETLYVVDHGLWGPPATLGDPGPLGVLGALFPLWFASVALALAWDYTRRRKSPLHVALHFIGMGFSLDAAYLATVGALAEGGSVGIPLADGPPRLVWGLALVPNALAVLLVAAHALRTRDKDARRHAAQHALLVLLAAGSGAGVVALYAAVGEEARIAERLADAFWALTLPALVLYALARHQPSGISLRVRFAISQTTIAAMFIAVFFTVSELAGQFLSTQFGLLLGLSVAGVLVFFLAPLERLAKTIADSVLPPVEELASHPKEQRFKVYRDQCVVAWADGAIDGKERVMLDRLRRKLKIAEADALRLEQEAADV